MAEVVVFMAKCSRLFAYRYAVRLYLEAPAENAAPNQVCPAAEVYDKTLVPSYAALAVGVSVPPHTKKSPSAGRLNVATRAALSEYTAKSPFAGVGLLP